MYYAKGWLTSSERVSPVSRPYGEWRCPNVLGLPVTFTPTADPYWYAGITQSEPRRVIPQFHSFSALITLMQT